jgi:hypothetical protein
MPVFNKIGYAGQQKTLYHATNLESAIRIMLQQRFNPGKGGLFGKGIYYAETKEEAIRRSLRGGEAVLCCVVCVGESLYICGCDPQMTPEKLAESNCDSVFGENTSNQWREYVIYDSRKIKSIDCITHPTLNLLTQQVDIRDALEKRFRLCDEMETPDDTLKEKSPALETQMSDQFRRNYPISFLPLHDFISCILSDRILVHELRGISEC